MPRYSALKICVHDRVASELSVLRTHAIMWILAITALQTLHVVRDKHFIVLLSSQRTPLIAVGRKESIFDIDPYCCCIWNKKYLNTSKISFTCILICSLHAVMFRANLNY